MFGGPFPCRAEKDGKLYVTYQVIGRNHVAVPTHFFKMVIGEAEDGNLDMEVYVMPNKALDDSIPLAAYYVSHLLLPFMIRTSSIHV
jgi:endonuclease G